MIGFLVVLGLFSYRRLAVDLFPNIDFPIVTVTTTLNGASVEEMESGVTKPIEEAINTIEGIDELRSETHEGLSRVIVFFVLERNSEAGAQDVRDKVAAIVSQLPEGTDPPVVEKFDIESTPILSIAVSGNRDLREVTEIARKQIKEDIETLHGVGSVTLVGGLERAINIVLDTDRLAAYGLSIDQVKAAIRAQNIEVPGGHVDQGKKELILRTMGRIERVGDFPKLIVANVQGRPLTRRRHRPRRGRLRRAPQPGAARRPAGRLAAGAQADRHQHRSGDRHGQAPPGDHRSPPCRRTSASRSSATTRASSSARSTRCSSISFSPPFWSASR